MPSSLFLDVLCSLPWRLMYVNCCIWLGNRVTPTEKGCLQRSWAWKLTSPPLLPIQVSINLQKILCTEIPKQNLLYHVAQNKLYQFPLFQPVTSLEIWWSVFLQFHRFHRENEVRKGRERSVCPSLLPEGRTCSSRSCFILDRWLSNVSLKFLSHRDLLTCFEVSLVESQLNLLQWSYFARVPLAIRISFLACFRFFLYACFLHVFLFLFSLFLLLSWFEMWFFNICF